jgi:hypothetical protein
MNITVERRNSAWIRTASADNLFAPDVAAATLQSAAGLFLTPAGALVPTAVASWPAVTRFTSVSDVIRSGICIFDSQGNNVSFKIASVLSAIGQRLSMGDPVSADMSALITQLPFTTPAYNAAAMAGARWAAQYLGRKDATSWENIFSAGNLNTVDGDNSRFTRLLTSLASQGEYPYAQVDSLLPAKTISPMQLFDLAYTGVFLGNSYDMGQAVIGLANTYGLFVDMLASLTTQIEISVDLPYQGFEQTAQTDLYLYLPRNIGTANQLSLGTQSMVSPSPANHSQLTTYVLNEGAIIADIIPFNQIIRQGQASLLVAPFAGQDVFAVQPTGTPTPLTASVSYDSDAQISLKQIDDITLLGRPAAIPAHGFI